MVRKCTPKLLPALWVGLLILLALTTGFCTQVALAWEDPLLLAPTLTAAPTAKSGLIYTGEKQALINAGVIEDGKFVYSLDGVSWSEEIPQGTDAGEYQVSYKWIDDQDGEGDVNVLSVSIAKAYVYPDSIALTYDGQDQRQAVKPSFVFGGETHPINVLSVLDAAGEETEVVQEIGQYVLTVELTPADQDNFALEYPFVSLSINGVQLVVTPSVPTPICFLDDKPTIEYTLSGWLTEQDGERWEDFVREYVAVVDTNYRLGSYPGVFEVLVSGQSYLDEEVYPAGYKEFLGVYDPNPVRAEGEYDLIVHPKQILSDELTVSGGFVYDGADHLLDVTAHYLTEYSDSGETKSFDFDMTLTPVGFAEMIGAGTYRFALAVPDEEDPVEYVNYKTLFAVNPSDSVSVTIAKADPILIAAPTAKTDLVYNGEGQTLLNAGTVSAGALAYSLDGVEWSTALPSACDAGDYTVYYRIQGDDNYNDAIDEDWHAAVNIAKASPTLTAHPQGAAGLIFDGTLQTLCVAGSASGGNYQYRLDGGDWTDDLPAATHAGDYTVRYRVVGDANHLDRSEEDWRFVVTVSPKVIAIVWAEDDYVYNATEQAVTATYLDVAGESVVLTVAYSQGGEAVSFRNAGDYTAAVAFAFGETDYALPSIVTHSYTIRQAACVLVSAPKAVEGLVYDGELLTLLSAGQALRGEVEYSLDGGEWTNELPQAMGANDYTIRYRVVSTDPNYAGVDDEGWVLTASIAPATLGDVEVAQEGALTYTGALLTPSVKATATSLGGQTVTFAYSSDLDGVYGALPSFSTPGTYTVYYVATAPNHLDSKGSFEVTVAKRPIDALTQSGRFVYNGQDQTALIDAYFEFDGQAHQVAVSSVTQDGEQASFVLPGEYDVRFVLNAQDEACFELSVDTLAVSIAKLQLIVTPVVPADIRYLDEQPSLDCTITGWLGDEDRSAWEEWAKSHLLSLQTDYTAGALPGAYPVTVRFGERDVDPSAYNDCEKVYDFAIAQGEFAFNVLRRLVGVSDLVVVDRFVYNGCDRLQEVSAQYVWRDEVFDFALLPQSFEVMKDAGEYLFDCSAAGIADRFELNGEDVLAVTVAKAPLSVTARDHTIAYGDLPASGGLLCEGFVEGEDESVFGDGVEYGYTYRQFDDVGQYVITPQGLVAPNYELTVTSGKLTVLPKSIVVTVDKVSSVYGSSPAVLSATVTSGAIVSDDFEVYQLSAAVTSDSAVGSYDVTGVSLNDNYDVTFEGTVGAYLVLPAALSEVSVLQVGSLTFDGSAKTPQVVTAATAIGGQKVTFGYKTRIDEEYGDLPAFVEAGTYTVYYRATAPNHLDTEGSFAVVISPAALSEVSVSQEQSLVYNDLPQVPELSAQAVAAGGKEVTFGYSLVQGGEYGDLPAFVDAGTYTVYYRAQAQSHADSLGQFEVTIAKRPLTVTVSDSLSIDAGDPLPVVRPDVLGLDGFAESTAKAIKDRILAAVLVDLGGVDNETAGRYDYYIYTDEPFAFDNFVVTVEETQVLVVRPVLKASGVGVEVRGLDPESEYKLQAAVQEDVKYSSEFAPFKEHLAEGEEFAYVYSVSLLDADGNEVQPDSVITIRLPLPASIKGKSFRLLHIHSSEDVSFVDYVLQDGMVVVTTDRLSQFAFVTPQKVFIHAFWEDDCLGWLAILPSVATILALVICALNDKKGKGLLVVWTILSVLFALAVLLLHLCIVSCIALGLALLLLVVTPIALRNREAKPRRTSKRPEKDVSEELQADVEDAPQEEQEIPSDKVTEEAEQMLEESAPPIQDDPDDFVAPVSQETDALEGTVDDGGQSIE